MPVIAFSLHRLPAGCIWLMCLVLTVGCVKVGPDLVRPTAQSTSSRDGTYKFVFTFKVGAATWTWPKS
jgi:hypothetical protein